MTVQCCCKRFKINWQFSTVTLYVKECNKTQRHLNVSCVVLEPPTSTALVGDGAHQQLHINLDPHQPDQTRIRVNCKQACSTVTQYGHTVFKIRPVTYYKQHTDKQCNVLCWPMTTFTYLMFQNEVLMLVAPQHCRVSFPGPLFWLANSKHIQKCLFKSCNDNGLDLKQLQILTAWYMLCEK